MNSRFALRMALGAAGVALAASAAAQTLYKLIDKNGKVTYSESRPKTFDGQVIRIDIDPNANTATLPKPADAKARDGVRGERPRSDGGAAKSEAEARIAQARERLESARRAYQEAQEKPGEGELQFLGNKGGGVRVVPSEAYQKRLDALEADVKRAEEELRRVEQGA
jgi:hypothetical protein